MEWHPQVLGIVTWISLGDTAPPPTLGQVDCPPRWRLGFSRAVPRTTCGQGRAGRGTPILWGFGEVFSHFGWEYIFQCHCYACNSHAHMHARTHALTHTLPFFITRKSVTLVTLHVGLFPGVKIAGSLDRASLVQGPSPTSVLCGGNSIENTPGGWIPALVLP